MPTRSRPNPRDLDFDRCYYCEMYLSTRHEHDHFPLQWTYGGEGTVPVCVNCHDLKDRLPLERWPPIGALATFEEVIETLVPPKTIELVSAAVPKEYPYWLLVHLRWVAVKDAWTSFSPIARVSIAKLLVIDQMGRQHAWRTCADAEGQVEANNEALRRSQDENRE